MQSSILHQIKQDDFGDYRLIQEVTLETINQLATRFSALRPLPSELNRSNVFCFAHTHKFNLLAHDEMPFVLSENYRGKRTLIPFFDMSWEHVDEIAQLLREYHAELYPVTEDWIELFAKDIFLIRCNADDSDYLYTTSKLANVCGKKLGKKRNLINQFQANVVAQTKSISHTTLGSAKQVLNTWSQHSTSSLDQKDHLACLKGLEHFQQLNLQGIVIYSQNDPIAMSLGEVVGNSYVVHFAKADITYKGVYQYLFRETARAVKDQCSFINLEQDLGLPSLRQTKKSYIPDAMIHKYTVGIKDDK